ncbi:TPA: MarR family transcriptional regulator [Klebsiella aerogenes]|nr:MarR family transcriptional regulator [Klebsiella aerogenes]EIV5435287.1 MarR family transcriptional regulator [Klebsiella aerogenes]ELA2560459.1 MarR family transcriptional regulator [Klebsiella aerogenes]HDS4350542.1 MarR family transcriptional regulator [Klebsiella aerogenes]HDS5835926.1 MarR family transcriptional regulator [Klebsiella aerogenes]
MITEIYSLTTTELNVMKVMAEKDIDWTWMILDRTLATRGIPGFSNVANIVTNLMNEGMVDAVNNENSSRPRYRVSEQGHQLLGQINEVTRDYDIS